MCVPRCDGVPQDASLAFCMFETAAEQFQHANALFNLAAMYANGQGVGVDPYKAQHYFQVSLILKSPYEHRKKIL